MSRTRMESPLAGPRGERGIALVSALLVVLLIAVVGGALVLRMSGERSVSSNVQVARASLLSADAGVRVAQQVLANQAKAKMDQLAAMAPPNTPIITSPQTFFPSGPQSVSSANPEFQATATITFADSNLAPTAQSYNFRYVITSLGNAGGQGRREVQSTGILRVSAERGTFADYLMFTDVHLSPSGGEVWFTSSSRFDGRVHTNGQFRFAFQPMFQDLATSVHSKAFFFNNNSPQEVNASYYGTSDTPIFYGGFERGVTGVPLPASSAIQQNAALGLAPNNTPPSNSAINGALGLGSGSSPPPDGVRLVTSGLNMTGGIYVQGNLDRCAASADTVTNIQTWVLTQGTNVSTITIDRAANTTTLAVGAGSTTYTGVPQGVMFVNGSVFDLRGPDRVGTLVVPALARGERCLIAATGDIVIRRDLICDDYADATNVLGLYSRGGDVVVGSDAPSDFFLDAFVMSTGPSGAFRVENFSSGGPRGAFHLRGGVTQRYFGEFYTADTNGNLLTGFWRDFHYDRRGLIPPNFPSTNRYVPNQPTARTLAWKEI